MKLVRPLTGTILFIALLLLCTASAYSQSVYVNTQKEIFQLTGGPGSTNRLTLTNECGRDSNILSIAVYKETVYYSTWAGELKSFKPGVPGSCETLIESGISYTAMTVDKNGILYMGTELLARYNPYTKQLTDLGRMPFFSSGDMLFYKDKLLMAGWDTHDWSSGIFEINPDNLAASKLYMKTDAFIGLLSFAVPCGNSRYYGLLTAAATNTQLIELDLVTKRVIGAAGSLPAGIMDGGSATETGIDDKVSVDGIIKTNPDNCANSNGSIVITASSLHMPVSYTLLNTGSTRPTGNFMNLRGGRYDFRIEDAAGCIKDTSIVVAETITTGGCNDIFIPTAFTPNNDGRNDLFSISFPSSIKDIALQIFNRGGTKVYEGRGNTIAWDGNYRGVKQPSGVYVYTLTYKNSSGAADNRKGTLTLIQ